MAKLDITNSPLKAVNGKPINEIKIGGTDTNPIYITDHRIIPSKFDWNVEDISQSTAGRTESGKMLKQTVRANVMSISLSWRNIPLYMAKEILKLFQMDTSTLANEYFTLTYYDYFTDTTKTGTFYVGNRQISEYNHKLKIVSELSFNVILV